MTVYPLASHLNQFLSSLHNSHSGWPAFNDAYWSWMIEYVLQVLGVRNILTLSILCSPHYIFNKFILVLTCSIMFTHAFLVLFLLEIFMGPRAEATVSF